MLAGGTDKVKPVVSPTSILALLGIQLAVHVQGDGGGVVGVGASVAVGEGGVEGVGVGQELFTLLDPHADGAIQEPSLVLTRTLP